MYAMLVQRLGWSLNQIDETDFETLMDFLFYHDPDVRAINGRQYRRARGVPTWL
jgi:hypothetical protein